MRRYLRRSLALLLSVLMALSAMTGMAVADETDEPEEDAADVTLLADAATDAELLTTESGNNVSVQNHNLANGSAPIASYFEETDNGYMRADGSYSYVLLEFYDREFNLTEKKYLEKELSYFGGFYSGEDAYYLFFGQDNHYEDNSKEVFRVVKYSKNWERLDQASLCGANTYSMFYSGCCRMAECNGYLYIRTAHQVYDIGEGVHHQANMMLELRESDMEITYLNDTSGGSDLVSHSLDQYVLVDDENNVITLDQADGGPARGLVLMQYKEKAGNGSLSGSNTHINVFPFQGESGNYSTGASAGGLEYSSSSYLAAGSSVVQDENWNSYSVRNIFVTSTSRDDFSENGTTVRWITDYPEGGNITTSSPQLVKLGSDSFLLLWSVLENSKVTDMQYVYLDGKGNTTSEIYTSSNGRLSECEPCLCSDGSLAWYVTGTYVARQSSAMGCCPVFYKMDKNGTISVYSHDGLLYRIEDGKAVIYYYLPGELPEDLIIPATIEGCPVTEIYNYSFDECSVLKSISIKEPADITIGIYVFRNCTNLETLTIGTCVTYIPSTTFNGCDNIANIYYDGTLRHWFSIANSVWGANITDSSGRTFTNCGTCGSYAAWGLVTDGTLVFTGTGTINIYGIGYAPWYDLRENITSVIIEDGITDVAQWMFYDMLNIQSIEIPDTVTSIGHSAFCNCSSLKSITLPDSVTSISNYAFENCTSLENIVIPNDVTYIGYSAFEGCTGLKSVVIQAGNEEISSRAFYGCSALNTITFEGNAPSTIGSNCFYGVTATALYPCSDTTWTSSVMRDYGGTITWSAEDHTWGNIIWTWSSDHSSATASRTCSACGATETENATVTHVTTEPTCTNSGRTVYTATAVFDGQTYRNEVTETIAATGHSWGKVEWTWSSNYKSATASQTCSTCGAVNSVTATVTSSIQKATCTDPEQTTYTATAVLDGVTYTDAVTMETGPALGHSWGDVQWVWSSDHSSATASRTCSTCGATETENAAVTSVTTSPTCTSSGKTVYTGTVVFDGVTYKDEETVILAATGHSWGKADWTWSSDLSSASVTRTCNVCGVTEQAVATVTVTTTEPTCTEPGMKTYTAKATLDGTELTDTIKEETASALGHIWGEPTWTWSEKHSSASVSRTCQRSGCGTTETVQATVTSQVISEPTEEKDGEIVYTASATFSDGTKVSNSVSVVMPFTNKEALDEEIGKAEAEEKYKDDYTASSWADFQAALDAAKSVLNDVTATQEKVDQALANLEKAYENLVLAPIPEYLEGFNEKDGNWYYFVNGNIAYGMNDVLEGTVKGTTGWWYIVNGQVQLNYTGVCDYSNAYGWWYVKNGMVDFSKTSIEQNRYGWWRVVNGQVDFSCNSVEQNDYGWWYVLGGQVQFGYTGVANYANAYGWWYIKGGQVDFSRTSIEPNNYGWWRVVGGKVDFGCNSVEQNAYGWWYVVGGQVQFGYTGVANYANAYGWWYISGGKVDFNRNSVDPNNFGWWRVIGGKVDFSFTGWATNSYGRWYCVNGKVDFSRS